MTLWSWLRVEAFAASWIEILQLEKSLKSLKVEAFAASWIEIITNGSTLNTKSSKPLRLRGLKFLRIHYLPSCKSVEAFAASWIEMAHEGGMETMKKSKPLRLRVMKLEWGKVLDYRYHLHHLAGGMGKKCLYLVCNLIMIR